MIPHYEIFKNQAFRAYFLSCLMAMFGNGLTYIIMVWVLMQFSASVGSTAILMTCFWLPNVIFGPFFGVLADRMNRKKLLLATNGIRAVCLFIFAFYSHFHMSVLSVYFLAAVIGCVLAAYIPVAMSFIREIMPPENMLYANALVDVAYEMGAVLGMGLAGLILALTSVTTCFIINGICYLAATVLLTRIAYEKKELTQEQKEGYLKQMNKGWDYLRQRMPLIMIYVVQALIFVCYMTVPVLLAPFAKSILHTNVMQFGMLEAMLSAGIIVGGFISPFLASRYGVRLVIVSLIALGAAAFYLFSHTTAIHWAYFYHFLIGLSFSAWALLITLAQEMTKLEFQGRVQSLFNSFSGAVIIAFYYVLAHWQNLPLKTLYFGELGLLLVAGLVMISLLIKHREARYTIFSESN